LCNLETISITNLEKKSYATIQGIIIYKYNSNCLIADTSEVKIISFIIY